MENAPESRNNLEKILIRKASDANYENLPTHLDGVSLRVEKGERPTLLRKSIGSLAVRSRMLSKRRGQIKKHQEKATEFSDEIKDIAGNNPGVRGILSIKDNLRMAVFPKHTLEWDEEKLKEALGPAHSVVVNEGLDVDILIPIGHETAEGPLNRQAVEAALLSGLAGLGFSLEDLNTLVKIEPTIVVNEELLGQLIESNQVSVAEDAASVSTIWTVTTDPIIKE